MKLESPEVLEQERPLTLEEKAKLFPLSFWMRLGAKMKPQCFGAIAKDGGSCAIGAALDAVGISLTHDVSFFRFFPCLYDRITPKVNLIGEIAFRNDSERMTREQIADWLESIGY
jgi:hypothetical protein